MTDRPILFSAPMIRALLAGRKTQTRRIVNFPGVENVIEFVQIGTDKRSGVPVFEMKDAAGQHLTRPAGKHSVTPQYAPRFAKDDRLYVRETYSFDHSWKGTKPRDVIPAAPVHYWADGNPTHGDWTKPIPGIHMPRWASRLTLTAMDVRVQRLQECSKEDAAAEGLIKLPATGRYVIAKGDQYFDKAHPDPRVVYSWLWDEINGDGAWEANPWIVALTFTVEKRNIDAC